MIINYPQFVLYGYTERGFPRGRALFSRAFPRAGHRPCRCYCNGRSHETKFHIYFPRPPGTEGMYIYQNNGPTFEDA